MGRKNKSAVWQYFQQQDKKYSHCILCQKSIANLGNTTNLKLHLKRRHSDIQLLDTGTSTYSVCSTKSIDKKYQDVDTEGFTYGPESGMDDNISLHSQLRAETKQDLKRNFSSSPTESTFREYETRPQEQKFDEPRSRKLKQSEHEDDCSLFGLFVASEMRTISNEPLRKAFKLKVMQMLVDISYQNIDE